MIIVIPARYGSSRFPGKPLATLAGKPMIQHVYENASKVKGCDGVYVATDDERIKSAVAGFGGNAVMTSAEHVCGTDRVYECVRKLDVEPEEVVINIQGDEPFLQASEVEKLAAVFADRKVQMASLMRCKQLSEKNNPNEVKVVVDALGDAIYFSRCLIPYQRDEAIVKRRIHVGIYGYRAGFLSAFVKWPKSQLEEAESLEQLRAVENGIKIRMVEVDYEGLGIDTPEQLDQAERLIEDRLL